MESIYFTIERVNGRGLFEYSPHHHLYIRKFEYKYKPGVPISNFKIKENTYIDTQALFGYKPYFQGVKVDGLIYEESPADLNEAKKIADAFMKHLNLKPFYVRGQRGRIEIVHFKKEFINNDASNLQLTVTAGTKSAVFILTNG